MRSARAVRIQSASGATDSIQVGDRLPGGTTHPWAWWGLEGGVLREPQRSQPLQRLCNGFARLPVAIAGRPDDGQRLAAERHHEGFPRVTDFLQQPKAMILEL